MIDPLPEDLPAGAGTFSRLGLVAEAGMTAWRLEDSTLLSVFVAARQTMCGNRRRKLREPEHPVSTELSYTCPTSVYFLRQEEAFVSQLRS